MPFIEWSDELKVGNETIDEHHRHLVELLNNAHDAFVYGMKKGELRRTIDALGQYAEQHFAAEESFMQNCAYPDYEEHLEDHRAFRATVQQLHLLHVGDNQPTYLEITDFLLEWLIRHINIVDRGLFDYLAQAPQHPAAAADQ